MRNLNPQNILSVDKNLLNEFQAGFGDALFEFGIKNGLGSIILHNEGIQHIMNSPMIPNFKHMLGTFIDYLNRRGYTCCQITDLEN